MLREEVIRLRRCWAETPGETGWREREVFAGVGYVRWSCGRPLRVAVQIRDAVPYRNKTRPSYSRHDTFAGPHSHEPMPVVLALMSSCPI